MGFGINEALGTAGAVVGTAMNLFGGARAARRKRRMIADEERRNESWFNQQYYSSPLERAAWQASVAGMMEGHNQRMANAKGSAAVMGASAGSVLAEKSSANQSMGQNMRDAAAGHEAFQQNAYAQYDANKQNLLRQKIDTETGVQESLSHAAGVASRLGAVGVGGKSTT